MTLKNTLTRFTLGSTIMLLSVGFVACTNGNTQASNPSPVAQNSKDPMPGMDHGSGMVQGADHTMTMDLGPQDEYFDLRFLDAMILHHQGAIEMAQAALQNSTRPEIKELAQTIIAAQQQEIQQMQDWRKAWYPKAGAEPMMYDASMGHMMPMSESVKGSMMMNQDLGAAGAQFDLRFLDAMIPHHEGAVVMAQQALQNTDRPELKKLAETIISSQQPEITEMEQWRKAWYGQ